MDAVKTFFIDVVDAFNDLKIEGKIIFFSIIALVIIVIIIIGILEKKSKGKAIKVKDEKETMIQDVTSLIPVYQRPPELLKEEREESSLDTYDIVEQVEERNIVKNPNESIIETLSANNLTDFEKLQEEHAVISYEELVKRNDQRLVEMPSFKPENNLATKVDVVGKNVAVDIEDLEPFANRDLFKNNNEKEVIKEEEKADKFLTDLKEFRKTLE